MTGVQHPEKYSADPRVSAGIIKKAQSFPEVLAGIASLDVLRESPSHLANVDVGWKDGPQYENVAQEEWPKHARSVLVLALGHPRQKPRLDWWDGKGTAGNRVLMSVAKQLKQWFGEKLGQPAHPLPYHVEKGGVFLKDAAVLAGLGIIGKNNLLVTPEFGPRVRLRAMFLEWSLVPTGPIDWFDPCEECAAPCRQACPQKAYASGSYARGSCMVQMESDRTNPVPDDSDGSNQSMVRYCRQCELACPVGAWPQGG
ncbi:MAG: epoxyqueuosine reductase [Deltaproteobacteria bacterium]|jgi:epoxyqueuosine reductase|nr:epoxyqueuosine reductase [Deltaproteobacteria bacterium]